LIDLRKFTIPTIYEVFQKWGLKVDDYMSFNGQDSCFNLKNGSKVFLISCRDIPSDPLYERFGSMQMTRGWIEEAGESDAKRNILGTAEAGAGSVTEKPVADYAEIAADDIRC
jgi:phage terminase large subunit